MHIAIMYVYNWKPLQQLQVYFFGMDFHTKFTVVMDLDVQSGMRVRF